MALNYSYVRSSTEITSEKNLIHLWEVGGGRSFSVHIDICITPAILASTMVVLVLDLSRLSRLVNNFLFWLKLLKSRIKSCLAKVSPQEAGKLKTLAKQRLG